MTFSFRKVRVKDLARVNFNLGTRVRVFLVSAYFSLGRCSSANEREVGRDSRWNRYFLNTLRCKTAGFSESLNARERNMAASLVSNVTYEHRSRFLFFFLLPNRRVSNERVKDRCEKCHTWTCYFSPAAVREEETKSRRVRTVGYEKSQQR